MSIHESLKTMRTDLRRVEPSVIEKVRLLQGPNDYCKFLEQEGCGEVGGLMLYGGLAAPGVIYGNLPAGDPVLVLRIFGDDMQGRCFAFDASGRVVEIDPLSHETNEVAASFTAFLDEWIRGSGAGRPPEGAG